MKLKRISSETYCAMYGYFPPETFMQHLNQFLRNENIPVFLGGEFDHNPVIAKEAYVFERDPFAFQFIATPQGVLLTIFAKDNKAFEALRDQFAAYLETL